jgi:hypothetical protein
VRGRTRQETLRVRVVGTDPDRGRVMCRDQVGNEFEIDTAVMAKGVGFPLKDEEWVLRRLRGRWVFDVQIGAPPIPTITGRIDTLHPLEQQMVRALAGLGVVRNRTRRLG